MGSQVKSLEEQLREAQQLAVSSDTQLKTLADDEIERLKVLLKDQEGKSEPERALIEIRAGTGGMEAELFASDLWEMYQKYALAKGWKVMLIDRREGAVGGIKRLVARLAGSEGNSPYTALRYESGVQRVQRVPRTEKQGRVHTSTATVAVLPDSPSSQLVINPSDIRLDVYRASGHGGQGVNTTDSAVRLTHLPTGLVVTCQDERSQIKNRAKALVTLQTKLAAATAALGQAELSAERREQIGTGDRSEKIRTYNFPQNRLTDHRLGQSWSNLNRILAGNLDKVINSCQKIAAANPIPT